MRTLQSRIVQGEMSPGDADILKVGEMRQGILWPVAGRHMGPASCIEEHESLTSIGGRAWTTAPSASCLERY